jgi:MoaA/NifB/PqqE/SkfB family radical SAM enzyme
MKSKLSNVVFREESYGGSIYNSYNGSVIRCDAEYFEKISGIKNNPNFITLPAPFFANRPEKVHLHITSKCDQECWYCYSNPNGIELSFRDLKVRIDECKKLGVFQIALGGGEPTLHPEFIEILSYIKKVGIDCAITTNGRPLDKNVLRAISESCKLVCISADDLRYPFLFDKNSDDRVKLKNSISQYQKFGIHLGINFVYGPNNWQNMQAILHIAKEHDIPDVYFLLLKHSSVINRNWAMEKDLLRAIKALFGEAEFIKKSIHFDVCSTWILNQIFYESLNYFQGFNGCDAGRFAVSVSEDNYIQPCSFLGNKWKFSGDINTVWNSPDFCKCRDPKENLNCLADFVAGA